MQQKIFTSHAFKKVNQPTANGLTDAVIRFILLQKGFAFRVNNSGIWDVKKGRYKASGTIKGIPDIHATYEGHSIWIEIKVGRDKLSEAQKSFRTRLEKVGGEFWEVRNFDGFREQWTTFIQKIKAKNNGRIQTTPDELEGEQNQNQV